MWFFSTPWRKKNIPECDAAFNLKVICTYTYKNIVLTNNEFICIKSGIEIKGIDRQVVS